MTNTLKLSALIVATFLTACAIIYLSSAQAVLGSAPSGVPALIATSSSVAVLNSATLIVATSSCNARIISTASTSLMLTFDDKTPTAVFGVYQAASTTKEYDSGLYGCGPVRGISYPAGNITVIDSR
jgi:hypothetical protein